MSNSESRLSPEETVRRGDEISDRNLHPHREPDNLGRILAADVNTGDLAIADTAVAACRDLRTRRPDACVWLVRIGHRTRHVPPDDITERSRWGKETSRLITRRDLLIAGGMALFTIGCGNKSPTVATAPTPAIQGSKIALRGYQIVAVKAGEKLIQLPHPALRILAVALIISAVGSEILIVYLDDELRRREIREAISEEQRIFLEEQRAVTFLTENGQEESIPLRDNVYEATTLDGTP